MIGTTGVVVLAIGGGQAMGEVELRMAGGTERFLALAAEAIGLDETVLVVEERPGRVVMVERWLPMPS